MALPAPSCPSANQLGRIFDPCQIPALEYGKSCLFWQIKSTRILFIMHIRMPGTISSWNERSSELVLTGAQQAMSILLVEEDHQTALSIKLQLETNGFKVEMFTDPVLALAQYKKNPLSYDLVISDIKTARMSTFEFMRAIRLENSSSRILLITPFEIKASEFSKVLPENKVNGFVEKPLLLSRLVPSVREILGPPGQ